MGGNIEATADCIWGGGFGFYNGLWCKSGSRVESAGFSELSVRKFTFYKITHTSRHWDLLVNGWGVYVIIV